MKVLPAAFENASVTGKLKRIFACAEKGDTEDLADMLVGFSLHLRRAPVLTTAIVGAMNPYLTVQGKKAARSLAIDIDQHPEYRVPDFHAVPHYQEASVVALTYALAELADPSPVFRSLPQEVLRARLMDVPVFVLAHDIGHPGGNNGDTPFLFENISARIALTHSARAGYAAEDMERGQLLILGTEPNYGVPMIEKLMRRHRMINGARQAAWNEIAQCAGKKPVMTRNRLISALNRDPVLTAIAYLATKADIFFSMMPETYLDRTHDLQCEFDKRQIPLKLVDKDGHLMRAACGYFFDGIAYVTGDGFLLNSVERIAGRPARQTKEWAMAEAPAGTPLYASRSANLAALHL